jgi:ParB family chromosome partitioning protein
METMAEIVPIRKRRYEEIPLDKIKVINSRSREDEQFDMNVQSIDHVGLLKPIRVNDKFLERSGVYELICGEGRLIAHQRLGRPKIVAEVVTCTRKDAYLQSLIENIARSKPDSMDFARELKRLHDEGWDYQRIGLIAMKPASFIRQYIQLVEQGEDRLVQGVEQGVFPISFAVKVAASEDSHLQNVLMDAFGAGLVTTNNFRQARKIINARSRDQRQRGAPKTYSVGQLKQDIVDATQAKTSYVREARTKENRFVTLFDGINTLWKDRDLVNLLQSEKLTTRPQLSGDFRYESPGREAAHDAS